MTIDIACVLFVLVLAVFGWLRGLLSQVATIGAAVGLWLTRDLWADPVGSALGVVAAPLREHPFLGRMAGFVLLYLLIVIAVAIVERLVVNKSGPLKTSNHWLGAALGGTKGVLYAVPLLWLVQSIALWERTEENPAPEWLTESVAMEAVGPWNPVRLFSLQELVDEAARRVREGDEDGEAAEEEEAATPRTGRAAQRLREGPAERRQRRAVRRAAIQESDAVAAIVEEAAGDEGWADRSYRQLLGDPLVQQVLADPRIRDLLFGGADQEDPGEEDEAD